MVQELLTSTLSPWTATLYLGLAIIPDCLVLDRRTMDSESDEYAVYVKGTVKNTCDRGFTYVQVEINFYHPDGSLENSGLANVNNLGAGDSWSFTTPSIGSDGGTWRIEKSLECDWDSYTSCSEHTAVVAAYCSGERFVIALKSLFTVSLATMQVNVADPLSNDPGLAALAARMLTILDTVPFDGALRHYRGYMFDVKDAAFTRAYATAITDIPVSLRTKYSWIGSFQGVSGPNELISDGTRHIVYSEICMPHSCPDHTVYAFFDPANKQVWGVLNVDGKGYPFGIQHARQEAIVQAVIGRSVAAYGNDASTFPLSGKALAVAEQAIIESDGTYAELFYKLDRAMME